MSVIIPTSREASSYTQRTTLDGKDYVMRFQFNQRIGRWAVDILDGEEDPIAYGLALRGNHQVGRGIVDDRFPKGVIVVVDSEAETLQDARDPGLFELGARFLLTYFEESELA